MSRSYLGRRRRHQANVHLSLNRRHAQPSRTRLLIPVLGHAHLIPAGRRIPVVRTVRTRCKRIVLLIPLGIPTHRIGTGRIVGAPQLNRRAFNRIGQQALVHHARRVGCCLGRHIAITRLEDRLHLLVRDQAVLVGLVDLGIGQLAPVDRNAILARALHLLAGNIVGAFGIGQLNRALRTYAGRSCIIGGAHHGTRRTGRQHAGDCHNGAHRHIGAVVAELAIQQILKRMRLLHGVTQRVNALPVVLGLLGLGKQARMLKLIALALALHLLHTDVHVLPVLAGIVHAVNAGKDADTLGRRGKRLAGRLPRIGLKDLSEHLALDLIALERTDRADELHMGAHVAVELPGHEPSAHLGVVEAMDHIPVVVQVVQNVALHGDRVKQKRLVLVVIGVLDKFRLDIGRLLAIGRGDLKALDGIVVSRLVAQRAAERLAQIVKPARRLAVVLAGLNARTLVERRSGCVIPASVLVELADTHRLAHQILGLLGNKLRSRCMVDELLDGGRIRSVRALGRREFLIPILAGAVSILKDHLVHIDAITVALLGQQRRRPADRGLELSRKLRGLVVASTITLAVAGGRGATSLTGSSTLGFVLFTVLVLLGKRISDHLVNRVVKGLVDIIKRVIHHILVPLLHGIRELLLALLGRGGMLFGRSVGVKTQHGHKLSIGDAVGLRHKDLLKVAAVHIGRVIRLVKLVEQLKVTLVHILRHIAHMGALARLLSQRNRHRLAIHAVHVQVERVGGLFVSHLERDIERPVGVLLLRQMVEGPQTLAGVLAVLDQALRTATIRHIKVPDRSARNIAHIIASRYLGSSGGSSGRAHARFERHTLGGKRILRQVVFNLGTAEFIGLAGVLCGRGAHAHGKLHAFSGRCVYVGHIAQ